MKKQFTRCRLLLSIKTFVVTPQCGAKYYILITFLAQSLLKACHLQQNPKLSRLRFFPPQVCLACFCSSCPCSFLMFCDQQCPLQKLPKKWGLVLRLSCSVRLLFAARTISSCLTPLSSEVSFLSFVLIFLCIGLSCFRSSDLWRSFGQRGPWVYLFGCRFFKDQHWCCDFSSVHLHMSSSCRTVAAPHPHFITLINSTVCFTTMLFTYTCSPLIFRCMYFIHATDMLIY